jgi:S-methylmethionine-dependent homocysteine/selenocysteine methylase
MPIRPDSLRRRLAEGSPLLLDAAMGTELQRRGVASSLPLWSARALLEAPETVAAIHRDEVAAGAEILTANTFRTHRRTLAKEGVGPRAGELTRKAVFLAQEASRGAPRPVFVLGSLSPLEDCYRPDLVPADAELEAEHAAQAQALLAAGVDGILVETHNTVRELVAAVGAARATGLPVIASMVTDGNGRLLSGEAIAEAVTALRGLAPDALSINCVPARRLADDLRRLASHAAGLPLAAYGNLGPPADPEGLRFTDKISPSEYAGLAGEWLSIGARMVGGCCGTTAAYTAALAARLGAEPERT